MADLLAALDLGSNSFHLLLVRPEGSGFVVVERLKEKVQLASGLRDGKIQDEAYERGLACLSRFAQRLAPIEAANVHIVGTSALRKAGNTQTFVARVEDIFSAPVDVVSGAEEARLVYLGVAHHVGRSGRKRMVIDIGGGSTEVVQGFAETVEFETSIDLGCVALTDEVIAGHAEQAGGYAAARAAALATVTEHLADRSLPDASGVDCDIYGTSGTIESVATVLASNGWATNGVTRDGLRQLEAAIVDDRWLIDAGLPGLDPDRVDIFPAGVAILSAVFEVLDLDDLTFVDVSLMQGLVCKALDATDRRRSPRSERRRALCTLCRRCCSSGSGQTHG